MSHIFQSTLYSLLPYPAPRRPSTYIYLYFSVYRLVLTWLFYFHNQKTLRSWKSKWLTIVSESCFTFKIISRRLWTKNYLLRLLSRLSLQSLLQNKITIDLTFCSRWEKISWIQVRLKYSSTFSWIIREQSSSYGGGVTHELKVIYKICIYTYIPLGLSISKENDTHIMVKNCCCYFRT